ncbi:unnamed protein product, partial [Closterium sp. NIES-53]
DHFLSLCPIELTVHLLEERLAAVEKGILAVGASRGTHRTPFFEGCSPVPLLPSVASAAAVDLVGTEEVGAASTPSGGSGSSGGGGGGGGAGRGSAAQRRGFGPSAYVLRTGTRSGEVCGLPHTTQRCFGRLTDASRTLFPDSVQLPRWHDLLLQNVPIFDLDFDALLAAMYSLADITAGDCYLSVPPDPGTAAAALGASAAAALGASASAAPGARTSTLSNTAPTEALHNFTLDSGASRSFFRDSTTLTPLSRPVAVSLADPSGGPVLARSSTVLPCPAAPSGLLSGLHLPSFSMNLVSGADLQDAWVAASSQVFATASRSSPASAPCSWRPLTHETLLWHHRLGHPSLSRLRGMASRTLVSGLPRSLPPLPPGPVPTCVPCVEGRQRAAPHSSSFPPTEAPLQARHMDVWGPASVHRGGEFSSDLLRAFCRSEGIRQTFTLPASPQQNGISERRIGMVMDVARPSMIHAAAPHFLWPFAVQYAAHQINLQPHVSLPETTPTLRWTGKVGDASAFRVWGSRAFVRDTTAHKLSSRAVPCVFLGFPPDAPGWQFYHPTSRRVLSSQDVTFNESFVLPSLSLPHCLSPPPPAALRCPRYSPGRPPPPPGSCPLRCVSGRPCRAGRGGCRLRRAEPGGAESRRAEPRGAEPGRMEPEGTVSGGAEPARAASGGALGVPPWREPLSPQQLREWYSWRCRGTARASGGAAGAAGGAAASGAAGGAGGAAETGDLGAEGTSGVSAPASPLPGPYSGPTGGLKKRREPESRPVSPASRAASPVRTVRAGRRVPLPSPPASSLPASPDPESDSLRAASPAVTRFLATAVTDPLFESSASSALVTELVDFAAACRLDYAASLVAASVSVCPPSVGGECAPGTDGDPDALDIPTPRSYAEAIEGPYSSQWQAAMDAEMASWKSTDTYVDEVPPPGVNIVSGMWIFRVKRPSGSPPAFKVHYVACGFSQRQGVDFFQTFSPTPKMTTLRVLLHVAAQRDYELHSLDFSTAFLQGSLHEEIWLRRPPGFTGSFPAEAIEGPYSSQWQAAMDAEMASWKSTDTYVDEVPPPGVNIVSGMWIFRVKRPPGSPPVFKARYVARGFSQRQGVDFFQTFSPTPKMTTLRVLLHVAAQRDYELHSLDFSTAFLQGSLHEEIWLRRPPGFTGLTLASLGFAPSKADPSLFLRTDTTLRPLDVLVYVDNLVFTTADTEALAHVKSNLQKRHTCTDLGELTSYLGLRITRDRAQRTITFSASTSRTPRHSPLLCLSVTRSQLHLRTSPTSGMGLVLGGRARVVLTGHADASWVDDLTTQRSSQGYTFSLGSGSVSWRSTRSSSVPSSSCEAEIYAGAMAT